MDERTTILPPRPGPWLALRMVTSAHWSRVAGALRKAVQWCEVCAGAHLVHGSRPLDGEERQSASGGSLLLPRALAAPGALPNLAEAPRATRRGGDAGLEGSARHTVREGRHSRSSTLPERAEDTERPRVSDVRARGSPAADTVNIVAPRRLWCVASSEETMRVPPVERLTPLEARVSDTQGSLSGLIDARRARPTGYALIAPRGGRGRGRS